MGRGEEVEMVMVVVVAVVVLVSVVAGKSEPRLRLRGDLEMIRLSSMSVLSGVSGGELSGDESSSACSSLMLTLGLLLWPRANAEMVFAACRVERRTRLELGEVASNILLVSCDSFEVRIV